MSGPNKFQSVAKIYSEKFGFDPYYSTLVGFLEKYCSEAQTVLEVGAANGIVPEKWDLVRKNNLEYYSVEPVKEMVELAKEKSKKLAINYHPFVGGLENAVEAAGLLGRKIDVLIFSRSLHEIYLDYNRNLEKVFSDFSKIITKSTPNTVVYGDLERNTSLTPEETRRLKALLTELIGHGHDPATDYIDFAEIVIFMKNSGYSLVEEQRINRSLPGFEKSPWNFKIGVFKK